MSLYEEVQVGSFPAAAYMHFNQPWLPPGPAASFGQQGPSYDPIQHEPFHLLRRPATSRTATS